MPLCGGGEIRCHSGEPGPHPGVPFAAEPYEHLENRVTITKQRAPDRLCASRHHAVRGEPAAWLLMRQHGIKQRLDPVEVTRPYTHVGEQVEQVGSERGALVPRQPYPRSPVRQTLDQVEGVGICHDPATRLQHVRIRGRSVEHGVNVTQRAAGSSELSSRGTGSLPNIFAQAFVTRAASGVCFSGILAPNCRRSTSPVGASASDRDAFLRRVLTSVEVAAIGPGHHGDDQPERRTPDEHWDHERGR